MNKLNEIVEEWDNEDREYLNKSTPIHGLQTNFKNKKVIDFAQDFFQLSKNGLSKRRIMSSNNEFDETNAITVNKLKDGGQSIRI